MSVSVSVTRGHHRHRVWRSWKILHEIFILMYMYISRLFCTYTETCYTSKHYKSCGLCRIKMTGKIPQCIDTNIIYSFIVFIHDEPRQSLHTSTILETVDFMGYKSHERRISQSFSCTKEIYKGFMSPFFFSFTTGAALSLARNVNHDSFNIWCMAAAVFMILSSRGGCCE